ncbi:MAG: hypothetical protein ACKO34_06665 [Vampirovibrionales bacterium]
MVPPHCGGERPSLSTSPQVTQSDKRRNTLFKILIGMTTDKNRGS